MYSQQENSNDVNVASAPHIATQQEKLDAIFGITGGKNIDEFLDGLQLDDKSASDSMLSAMDSTVQDKISEIEQIQKDIDVKANDVDQSIIQISSIEKSLQEIEDIIYLAKDVMKHVANSILATPLIDSEAVQAYSKLMESLHINIAEFISLYKDKNNFLNKVKFAMFKQEQTKELLKYKHELELERIKAKDPKTIEADTIQNGQVWKQEDITKFISEQFSQESAI